MRSKTRWFTGFCNSHHVSHFATFFIDARAEISVAGSHLVFCFGLSRQRNTLRLVVIYLSDLIFLGDNPRRFPMQQPTCPKGHIRLSPVGLRRTFPPQQFCITCARVVFCKGNNNDPSAGSPTETLLRLLLPLNDKVQWTSRDVTGGEPPASPRSEHFTGPFNR